MNICCLFHPVTSPEVEGENVKKKITAHLSLLSHTIPALSISFLYRLRRRGDQSDKNILEAVTLVIPRTKFNLILSFHPQFLALPLVLLYCCCCHNSRWRIFDLRWSTNCSISSSSPSSSPRDPGRFNHVNFIPAQMETEHGGGGFSSVAVSPNNYHGIFSGAGAFDKTVLIHV